MNEAGVDWRMVLHGGNLHAFTVPGATGYGMPGLRYDPVADARSWRAMLDLFSETFGELGRGRPVLKEGSGPAPGSDPLENARI